MNQAAGKTPINSSDGNLSESLRVPTLAIDNMGNLPCMPVVLIDTRTGKVLGAADLNAAGGQQLSPNVFKVLGDHTTGTAAAWTPAAGKKFRLMGGIITVSKEAACAGKEVIWLKDNATVLLGFQISLGALTATGNVIVLPFTLPGNGYLSVAADNPLNVQLNGALTAGAITVSSWGREE